MHSLPKILFLLPLRLVLFAAFQGTLALVFLVTEVDPWSASIRWWPVGVVAANLVTISVLIRLLKSEGVSYGSLFRWERLHWPADVLPVVGLSFSFVLLAIFPNLVVAQLIFGSFDGPSTLFLQPLPFWAACTLLVLFPVTIAVAEIPFYFGYIARRLELTEKHRLLARTLPALFAAAQHITMPLLFDARFIVWRLLAFVPLSFFLGFVLTWRPHTLIYFIVLHGLLDAAVIVAMF